MTDAADVIPVLEIGGTHVTAGMVDASSMTATWRRRHPLDADASAPAVLDALAAAARGVPGSADRGWGVAIPGPFDYERGIGRFQGVAKFAALDGVDVRHELATRIGADPGGLVFINDADSFAGGEWEGSAERPARAVFLTLGTGVGSSFLEAGSPVREAPGVPPDGRVHLLRFAGAPLEETVSRRAIVSAYVRACGSAGVDVRQIAERARGGDSCAAGVLDAAMTSLGRCIAGAVAAFAATDVVVGGSMAGSWDLLGRPLSDGLFEDRPDLRDRVRIRVATVADAVLIGAAMAVASLRTPPAGPPPSRMRRR